MSRIRRASFVSRRGWRGGMVHYVSMISLFAFLFCGFAATVLARDHAALVSLPQGQTPQLIIEVREAQNDGYTQFIDDASTPSELVLTFYSLPSHKILGTNRLRQGESLFRRFHGPILLQVSNGQGVQLGRNELLEPENLDIIFSDGPGRGGR